MKTAAPRLGTSLAYGRPVAVRPGEVVLAFPKETAFHRSSVAGAGKAQVEKILSAHFGAPTRLRIEDTSALAPTAPPSPAERDVQEKDALQKQIEAQVRGHPAVQAAVQILGGEVEAIQVPRGPGAVPADASEEIS